MRRIEERHRRIYPLSHRYGAEGSRQRRPRKRWETVTESQGALELGLRHRIAGGCRKAQRRGVPNGITDCGCVRDAGSAANDRVALAGNPVGEAQTWPEIVRVGHEGPLRRPVQAGEGHHARGSGYRVDRHGIERIHLIADHSAREFRFPSQAGIDREAIGEAPVVLRVEGQILGARPDGARSLNASRVHLTQQEAGQCIAGTEDARQICDQGGDCEIAGRATVAAFVVRPKAELAPELQGVLAAVPGDRFQKLMIADRRLNPAHARGISQRRPRSRDGHGPGHDAGRDSVAWDREGRKGRGADSLQSYFRRQVVPSPRTPVHEFAAQIAVAQRVRKGWAEDVSMHGEKALNAHIVDIG